MINILHLSDLHLTQEQNCSRKNVLDELIVKLKDYVANNPSWAPEYLVISGDISSKGSIDEFKIAKEYMLYLIKELKIDQNKVILAVGNHDKYRGKPENDIIKKIGSRKSIFTLGHEIKGYDDAIKKMLNVKDDRYNIFNNFNSIFNDFIILKPAKLDIKGWDPELDKTQGLYEFKAGEMNLVFVVLNSAYYCIEGIVDYGRLSLDEPFVEQAEAYIKQKKEDKIVVSVMHHNPGWLNWEDRLDMPQKPSPVGKILSFSNLILTGHEHCVNHNPDFLGNQSQLIIGGATYTKPTNKNEKYYYNNYSIIQLNELNKSFKRKSFIYLWIPGNAGSSWHVIGNEQNYPTVSYAEFDPARLNRLELENTLLRRRFSQETIIEKLNMEFEVPIHVHADDLELIKTLFSISNEDQIKPVKFGNHSLDFYVFKDTHYIKRVHISDTVTQKKICQSIDDVQHETDISEKKKFIIIFEFHNKDDVKGFINLRKFKKYIDSGQLEVVKIEK